MGSGWLENWGDERWVAEQRKGGWARARAKRQLVLRITLLCSNTSLSRSSLLDLLTRSFVGWKQVQNLCD